MKAGFLEKSLSSSLLIFSTNRPVAAKWPRTRAVAKPSEPSPTPTYTGPVTT